VERRRSSLWSLGVMVDISRAAQPKLTDLTSKYARGKRLEVNGVEQRSTNFNLLLCVIPALGWERQLVGFCQRRRRFLCIERGV